jgi:hypothetical protein
MSHLLRAVGDEATSRPGRTRSMTPGALSDPGLPTSNGQKPWSSALSAAGRVQPGERVRVRPRVCDRTDACRTSTSLDDSSARALIRPDERDASADDARSGRYPSWRRPERPMPSLPPMTTTVCPSSSGSRSVGGAAVAVVIVSPSVSSPSAVPKPRPYEHSPPVRSPHPRRMTRTGATGVPHRPLVGLSSVPEDVGAPGLR